MGDTTVCAGGTAETHVWNTCRRRPERERTVMKVAEFLTHRREHWQELEQLCLQFESRRIRTLGPAAVDRFASLYRAACADLALADSYQLPPNAVQYLHRLVGAHTISSIAAARLISRHGDVHFWSKSRSGSSATAACMWHFVCFGAFLL